MVLHHTPISSTSSIAVTSESSSASGSRRRQNKEGVRSCAECRRLKLRCDRRFPCTTCTRRGCAVICPDGQLATGQGNRFILASTEDLHEHIQKLSYRIRTLEDGLRDSHNREGPAEPEHPLLASGLLGIKAPLQRSPRTTSLQIPQGIFMDDSPAPGGSSSSQFDFGGGGSMLPGFTHMPDIHHAFSNASAGSYFPQQSTSVPEISWGSSNATGLEPRPQSHLRSRSADSVPRTTAAPGHYAGILTTPPPTSVNWIPEMAAQQIVQHQHQSFHPGQYDQWARGPQDE